MLNPYVRKAFASSLLVFAACTSVATPTTPSTGAGAGGSGGADPASECTTPVDCPAPGNCRTSSCVDGACTVAAFADGTACETEGACVAGVCGPIPCDDVSPCRLYPCTSAVCAQHICTSSPATAGTPCDAGKCDGFGVCKLSSE